MLSARRTFRSESDERLFLLPLSVLLSMLCNEESVYVTVGIIVFFIISVAAYSIKYIYLSIYPLSIHCTRPDCKMCRCTYHFILMCVVPDSNCMANVII